jgi:1-acyl-sn-glycerol-3-phosphate acyltransferase
MKSQIPKSFTFRPPRTNHLFTLFVKYVALPFLMSANARITSVEISEEDLERLRSLKGQRVILTPNHSEGNEPYAIFHLSKLLREDFNYLAAKEVFERYHPAGRLLQAVGVYSLVRGIPDRNSFLATLRILREGEHWLVVFPEGVALGLGDLVMPFTQGIVQLAFWAHEEVIKEKGSCPLYFVPIAIKPFYLEDMTSRMATLIGNMEKQVLPQVPDGSRSIFHRLLRIGGAILSTREKKEGLTPEPGSSIDERISTLREHIVARVAAALDVRLRPEDSFVDRIRDLFNTMDQVLAKPDAHLQEGNGSGAGRTDMVRNLHDELTRVYEFSAFHTGYLGERPTVERLMDVIGLLNLEIRGKREFWGPRKAVIKVGAPVDIDSYRELRKTERKAILREIAFTLESSVRGMLEELSLQSTPIPRREV